VIQYTKIADERREAGGMECWCLHGAVGAASDWRGVAKQLANNGISTRAVDLWRFLDCGPLRDAARALNAEAAAETAHGSGRVLLGYSMGGRIALHALLEKDHPWQAAVIVSAHPGLEDEAERAARRTLDMKWATLALAGDWRDFLERWDSQPVLAGTAIRPEADAARLMTRRQEIARGFVDWSLGAQEPLWDRLSDITIPVLWITGANDGKFTAIAARAAARMPRVTLATAPECGHRVPWEREVWFCDQVARFLKHGPGLPSAG
jgi:2-succinyl-6-hydroxy-2,4-cyclohexadiene-1-carboxylate synthase